MVGNAKRVAGHMSSEAIMKAHYPATYALMRIELDHRESMRSRERFLRTYSFLERLLNDIYGEEHEKLLPKVVRKEIPYPGPPKRAGRKRHDNLDFLDRFNQEDIRAILQGVATYKRTAFKVDEITEKSELDRSGKPVWAPYSEANLAEFENIIQQCETDWYREGVTDYRIKNRITTMKLFYDTWDMNRLYLHVKNGKFGAPKYMPLNDAEMAVITSTIKKHRKQGDRHHRIIEKCLADWQAVFRAERESAGGADETLIAPFLMELYAQIFERNPTDSELAENIEQFKLYAS
ncbi:MAG: hypothetical protein GY914_10455, partial [Prochlorococcus sp.]|nr:hypothetical protein [Prochlorococcus sp.]